MKKLTFLSFLRPTPRMHRPAWSHVASLLILAVVACSKDSTTGPSATPASIRIDAGNLQTGAVGANLPVELQVTVLDQSGKGISGSHVDWDVASGSGAVSTAGTTTDSKGQTRVTWTLGSIAGTARLTAQAGGVSPAIFTATAQPGPASLVIAVPDVLALGIGDTITVKATARDVYGNDVTGQPITFTAPDAQVATVSATGLVTALSLGSARIVATANAKADTVRLTVFPAGSSVCGSLAMQQLAVGQVAAPTLSGDNVRICLGAQSTNAEFGLIAYSASRTFSQILPFEVYGLGLATPSAPILAGSTLGETTFVPVVDSFDAPGTQPREQQAAELARRDAVERELLPLVAEARASFAERASARGSAAIASASAVPTVGTLLKLNAQGLFACSNADMRTGRVAAVGTKSIAVVDTANPASGYTDADYASIAATFDTLVYPVDVDNFGSPTDIGGNARVILFFTRAVNALTPPNANYVIGGFFFARDLYPKTARNGLPACAGSNETEMFYLLVPDPDGVINGNKRSKDQVTKQNLVTIAHEFQHLINAGHRLYITPNATVAEETWLDEGLSHTAEELLYFRMSGFGSRDNLTLQQVAATVTTADVFSTYQGQNFARLYQMLRDPEVNSPYATNDSLSTRGATWSFLRYTAGRQAGTESAFFRALVSSPNTGLANITNALPAGDLTTYLSDWSIATFSDDYALLPQAQLDTRYRIPAWNYRSIFPALKVSGNTTLGVYPLAVRQLGNNVMQRLNLAGGASGYLRFAVPANRSGVISLSSNGIAPNGLLSFAVVRVR